MAKKLIVTEALVSFCARVERDAQPLTVCRVTHPDAVDGDAFEGTYAGYPLVRGATAEAQLSDGSFVPARAAPVATPAPVDPVPASPVAEIPVLVDAVAPTEQL